VLGGNNVTLAELDDARRERTRAIRAKHYQKYAERYREQAKQWRAANGEHIRAYRRAYKKRRKAEGRPL